MIIKIEFGENSQTILKIKRRFLVEHEVHDFLIAHSGLSFQKIISKP